MMLRKMAAASLGLLLATAALAADQQSYLGGAEFAFIKPALADQGCQVSWEPGPYFRNRVAERLFTPNSDTLTIKLMHAYFPYAPEADWLGRKSDKVQIGLFADINLRDSGPATPGVGGIPGRLVFYTDDYRLRQRRLPSINSNVYGPVPYPGGGLNVQLTLLEFDQSLKDKLTDSLLSGIADLGIKTSAGVPSYLQGPVTKLFEAAIGGARSRDDKFGQYFVTLDDRNDPDNPATTPLRTGYLVLTRSQQRDTAIDWSAHCFDPATGEVSVNGAQKTPPAFGYVVLAVLKNAGADAGRVRDAFTYQHFVNELSERSTAQGIVASTKEFTDALKTKAIANELGKAVSTLAMPEGSITTEERFDAATRVAAVIHKMGLQKNAVVLQKTVTGDRFCSYLDSEEILEADHARLMMRLGQVGKGKFELEKVEKIYATAPQTCKESLSQRDALRQLLMGLMPAQRKESGTPSS